RRGAPDSQGNVAAVISRRARLYPIVDSVASSDSVAPSNESGVRIYSVMTAGVVLVMSALPIIAAAQTPAPAPAPNPADAPNIRIGATLFADYTFVQSPEITDSDGNTVHSNAFNVGRSYINITGNISHILNFRITP